MLSKARIGKHPLHPMLVALPVTLYLATFASLIGFATTRDPFWLRVALWSNLVGVASAGLAAIPGAVDLLAVVPSRSAARRTGTLHAIANVAALVLFTVNLFLLSSARGEGVAPNLTAVLLLTGSGVLFTAAAGFLGWELVQRHHIGVLDQPAARAVNDPAAPGRWMDAGGTLPVTDSQVLAAEDAETGRWPRDESASESGRITRH